MGLGSVGDTQQYLQGIDLPADKEEVASRTESNGAPRSFVDQLRNATTERSNSPGEVLQAIQGP